MEKVLEILGGIRPDIDFSTQEGLIDNGMLDSFDIVSIVGELSSEFDIDITVEYIVPENFNSAKAINALVEKLKG